MELAHKICFSIQKIKSWEYKIMEININSSFPSGIRNMQALVGLVIDFCMLKSPLYSNQSFSHQTIVGICINYKLK